MVPGVNIKEKGETQNAQGIIGTKRLIGSEEKERP